MPNQVHIELLKRGEEYYSTWKRNNEKILLDLSEADLRNIKLIHCIIDEAKFTKANLDKADFRQSNLFGSYFDKAIMTNIDLSFTDISLASFQNSNLNGANLFGATLVEANLSGADLTGADLMRANLTAANLRNANLEGANLQDAFLMGADLRGANLSETSLYYSVFALNELKDTNFSKANMDSTVIVDCDLSECRGLNTIHHSSPSSIGIDTIIRSHIHSGDVLLPELVTFFLEAGIPKELVTEISKIVSKIKYYSVFICYGHPDEDFAQRLYMALRSKGVSCWYYPTNYTIGEITWREIKRKLRETDKMIVICSVNSLSRPAVKKEIEDQIDDDPEKILPISIDNKWKSDDFHVRTRTMDLKPFLITKNYADFSDKSLYSKSIEQLLFSLKK